MSAPVISMLMKKIARGDRSAVGALSKHLADRLLYVPVVSKTSAAADDQSPSNGRTVISIVKLTEGERSVVPAFTSEKTFREWKKQNESQADSLSLLGADLCMAVGADCYLLLDLASQPSIELTPEEMQLVAQVPSHNDDFEIEDGLSIADPLLEVAPVINELEPAAMAQQPVAQASADISEQSQGVALEASTDSAQSERVSAVAQTVQEPASVSTSEQTVSGSKKGIVVPRHRSGRASELDLLRHDVVRQVRNDEQNQDKVTEAVSVTAQQVEKAPLQNEESKSRKSWFSFLTRKK